MDIVGTLPIPDSPAVSAEEAERAEEAQFVEAQRQHALIGWTKTPAEDPEDLAKALRVDSDAAREAGAGPEDIAVTYFFVGALCGLEAGPEWVAKMRAGQYSERNRTIYGMMAERLIGGYEAGEAAVNEAIASGRIPKPEEAPNPMEAALVAAVRQMGYTVTKEADPE